MPAYTFFSEKIKEDIEKSIGEEVSIEVPKNKEYGDLAIPLFKLKSQEEREKVKRFVEEKNYRFVKEINLVGPFLNIKFNEKEVLQILIEYGTKEKLKKLFREKLPSYGKIVIEYSSPNANKPLHIGHLRNNVLGSTLANVFKLGDNEVITLNLINDRGVHICEAMLGYKLFSPVKTPNKKPDKFIGELYTEFKKKSKENPELEEKAQECLRKWEEGDKEVRDLWAKVTGWVKQGLMETYRRFGISFDEIQYESQLYTLGKQIVKDGFDRGIFLKDEKGNIYAPLEKFGLPNKILLREDGTSIYITQDIGVAKYRWEKFKFDKMVYVVANEQDTHFKQLFTILKLLGFEWWSKLEHYSYGLVNLPTGKMKSREGNVIEADDFMNEIKEEIKKNLENGDEETAEKLMIAAIKFMMLKYDAKKDFVFIKDKAISLQGESGVYLLYTIARINSLISKSNKKGSFEINGIKEETIEKIKPQIDLISQIYEVVKEMYVNKSLHRIFRFVMDLAREYNSFYQQYKIIGSKDEAFLIYWSEYVKEILEFFCKLVGVETVKKV